MPSDDGLRPVDEETSLPFALLAKADSEDPVGPTHTSPWILTSQDSDLLPQYHVLE